MADRNDAKDKLTKIIAEIVEQQVGIIIRTTLPYLVEQEVAKRIGSIKSSVNENKTATLAKTVQQVLPQQKVVQKKPIITEAKKFTKNASINAILNNVASVMTDEDRIPPDSDGNYASMLAMQYGSIGGSLRSTVSVPMTEEVREEIIDDVKRDIISEGAHPTIANAMIKDYSKFVKAITTKKTSVMPPMIAPRSIPVDENSGTPLFVPRISNEFDEVLD